MKRLHYLFEWLNRPFVLSSELVEPSKDVFSKLGIYPPYFDPSMKLRTPDEPIYISAVKYNLIKGNWY
ncbi:MAG: hypothetical protein ACRENZ_09225 [Thermodesulfobacteriota bacterium]